MAVPNATITKNIALASDGWRRTAYPDGTLPNAGPTAPPEFTTSKNSTSITATITNANGATRFRVRVDSGAATDGLTKAGLSPNTPYLFQVQGENDYGVSDWSQSVTITTSEANGLTDPARLFTIARTFEGTSGVQTSLEPDGFDGADGRSIYSAEQAANGSTSGKMTVLTTDDETSGGGGGFGQWGGIINLPQDLLEGDEIFLRWRMYYPSGFNHYTSGGGGHVKFVRLRSETSGGSNTGYLDIYWDSLGSSYTYKFIKEGVNVWNYFAPKASYPHLFDQWVTYNVHYVLHSDPAQGKVRVWRGNDLILDSTEQTLNTATDKVVDFYMFTYWNGDVPQDQSCYVDDVKITSDRNQTITDAGSNYPWVGV